MPNTATRTLLLTLLALPTVGAVALLARSEAPFFPQEYNHEFYLVKGVVGLVAAVSLIVHMSQVWPRIVTADQRLRYLALLIGTTAVASSSTSQFAADQRVVGLNITGLIFVTVVVVAMVASIHATNRRP